MKLTPSETLFNTASNTAHDEYDNDIHHGEPKKTIVSNGASEVSGSYESNYAVPGWIVFPEDIFNTSHIQYIGKGENCINIRVRDNWCKIKVKDINETWTYLQNLFTKGVREDK